MKVSELIDKLAHIDPDLDVMFMSESAGYDWDWEDVENVETTTSIFYRGGPEVPVVVLS